MFFSLFVWFYLHFVRKDAKNMHFFDVFPDFCGSNQKMFVFWRLSWMLLFPTERWNRIPKPKSNSQPPRWLMPARWYLTLREHASGTCILNVHIQRHAFWPCILHMHFLDPAFWTYKFQVSTCILGVWGCGWKESHKASLQQTASWNHSWNQI